MVIPIISEKQAIIMDIDSVVMVPVIICDSIFWISF